MDLEVLNLKADASSVEKATDAVEALDNKLSRAEKTVAKAEQALKILRGEAVKVGDGVVRLGDGFTKSQANMLAMLKQVGATTAELKAMAKTMDQLNKITSTNPFDKSVQALNYVKKQREELTKSIKYAERYNDLTKEQISLMTRGIESVRQRAASEQKNFGEREAAVKKFIKEFVKEAQSYNQVTAAIEEKNRVAREEIRLQQETARAAQVSAKQRVDAEGYVQETLRRTLFINEQLEKGMSVSGAGSLYAYKQQLDVLGLSADQAAAKMLEFQNALTQNQTLRADRSPFKRMSEDIQETNRQVNHLARAVSVQLGDVFVSLASGQNPFIVAIQQGDQIRGALEQAKAAGQSLDSVMKGAFASMANSFVMVGTIVKDFLIDGIMSAGKLITNFNTSIIDAIGRMVGLGDVASRTMKTFEDGAAAGNKFSAAMVSVMNASRILAGGLLLGIITAIATFAVGSVKLSNDLDKLTIALNMSGASLGLTAQQAQGAAERIGETYGTNVYKALDAVTLFATKNIKFTDEMIFSATELSRVTGKSLSDIIDSYASLKGKPVEGLLDIAIATGQVDIETVKLIDKLVEQGDTAKAVELAMKEKARAEIAVSKQILAEMTPLGRLWDQMKKDVSSLSDAVYDLVTKSALVDVFRTAWEAVAVITSEVWYVLKQMGNEIGGIFAQIASVLSTKSFSGAKAIREMMLEDADAARKAQDELVASILSRGKTEEDVAKRELEAAAKRREDSAATAAQYKKEYESRKKGADEAGKEAEKTQKYFGKLMEGATDLALKTEQEVSKLNSGYDQMTDSQKMLFDAMNDRSKEGILLWDTLTERQKAEFENTLKLIEVNEERIQQYKAQVALQEVLSKWVDDYDSAATSIKEEVDALQLRNDLLFKTEDEAKAIQRQYDLNVKLAAVENKYIKRRNQMMMDYVDLVKEGNWSPEALVEYQRNMSAVNQQEAQERELVHKDANTQIVEDYEQKFKEIQGTVTDIIAVAMFEGGKAGSKKLKDVLKQSFRNYVIDVFINPIVGSIMGSITGGAGMSGQSSGGITGLISNASSAYNLATGSTVAGISGAVQGAGAFLGSSAVSSFGAGMTMTGTQVAALSEAGLIASKGAASLGSTFGAVMPWIAGGLLVADLLGVFDKKPSDKSSWATVDPTTGMVSNIGSMTGKKDPGKEQRDATASLAQMVGQFAGMAGITSDLVAMFGQRDGIRVKIVDGWTAPSAGVANGGDASMLVYGGIGDVETALVKMLDDLVDEGTLDQAIIDTWRNMKTEVDGTTRASGELISVLNLLTSGYEEMDIERANLLQTEGETLEQAYLRMLNVEKALKGVISTENEFTNSAKALAMEFERLGLVIPTSAETLGSVVSGLDLSSANGQSLYKTLMQLAPAFLQVEAAFESNYNLLLSEQELLNKNLKDLSKTFAAIGVVMPKSNQEFRNLIDAVNTTTSSGVELKAQLLSLVPAFVELQSASQNAGNSLEGAFSILNTIADQQIAVLRESFVETDRALAALERSINREKQLLQDRINTATETERVMTDMFNSLKEGVRSLRGEVTSTMSMQTTQARSVISGALATGMLPSPEILSSAVSSLTTGLSSDVYVSKAERDKAFIMLSNDLEDLQEIAEPQLTEAEQTVVALKAQIEILDSQLEEAKTTVDAIRGVDVSVESVDRAVRNLQTAMQAEEQSRAQIAKIEEQINFARLQYEELTNVNNNIKSLEQALANFNNVVMASKTPQATSGGITLPSNWGAYGEQQRADFFNAEAITASDLLSYGVPQSDIDYMRSHLNYKFYNGGYTGSGGMYEPAGIVHKGEVVWSQADVANAGGVAAVESLRLNGAMQPQVLRFDSSNIVSAIEELRTEVVMLRAETRAIVGNTSKSAKLLDRAMPDGQSILVTTTTA